MTNEWTKEIETLRARNAALEAALRDVLPWAEQHDGIAEPDEDDEESYFGSPMEASAKRARNALSGGASALDAVVSAAVAESRARTFRAAITYVTGDLRTPHPDADAEAKAFAAAVLGRLAAAVDADRAVNADMREAIRDLGATLDALIGGAQVQVDARSPNAVIGQAQLKRLRSFAEGHDADRRDVDEAIRDAERARVRARVEALAVQVSSFGPLVERQNVISAIGATEGGAP